ncbi:DUF2897 family protein [Psychromonas aquimarina]|uniref:DUF2897 family protein n=1 Tax=Psychromonas aquimarina TaxID=444919 RepID=UPI000425481F|nr:DUF2897 family protein [Psychromonas aquimarina]
MSGWTVFLIISLVLGVIISNLMVLKYTAKMKMPGELKRDAEKRKQQQAREDEQQKTTDKKNGAN